MKSELSKKNEYWLPKHRYYELKHFCLQYPYWKMKCNSIDSYPRQAQHSTKSASQLSPTEMTAEIREQYLRDIQTVDETAYLTDAIIAPYLILGVTENLSFDVLQTRYNMPCGRKTYYQLYRKFFYILSYTHRFQRL